MRAGMATGGVTATAVDEMSSAISALQRAQRPIIQVAYSVECSDHRPRGRDRDLRRTGAMAGVRLPGSRFSVELGPLDAQFSATFRRDRCYAGVTRLIRTP